MKLKIVFLAFSFCLLTGMTFGQRGHSSRGRSSSSRSSSSHHSSGNRAPRSPRTHVVKNNHNSEKTVHVRAYTKKNGTHVASYKRRPPTHH